MNKRQKIIDELYQFTGADNPVDLMNKLQTEYGPRIISDEAVYLDDVPDSDLEQALKKLWAL